MIVVTDEGGRDRLVNYIEWVSVYTESYIFDSISDVSLWIWNSDKKKLVPWHYRNLMSVYTVLLKCKWDMISLFIEQAFFSSFTKKIYFLVLWKAECISEVSTCILQVLSFEKSHQTRALACKNSSTVVSNIIMHGCITNTDRKCINLFLLLFYSHVHVGASVITASALSQQIDGSFWSFSSARVDQN